MVFISPGKFFLFSRLMTSSYVSVNGSMQLFEEFWNNFDLEHQSCRDDRSLRKEHFWKDWKHKKLVTSSRSLFQVFVLLNSVQKKVKDSIRKIPFFKTFIYIYIYIYIYPWDWTLILMIVSEHIVWYFYILQLDLDGFVLGLTILD